MQKVGNSEPGRNKQRGERFNLRARSTADPQQLTRFLIISETFAKAGWLSGWPACFTGGPMYFGSSSGYTGIDARGLWWVFSLVAIGLLSVSAFVGFGVYELIHHLQWVAP